MTTDTLELTVAGLKKAEFRGPVAFYDGRNGWARQDFECTAEPRFGWFWQRENRKDKGRQAFMVDGREVADLDEALKLLVLPADPDSPREARRRSHDEFSASPRLKGRATRALSEARCNGDAGPFGTVRAWMQRVGHPLHVGINHFAEGKIGKDTWPRWLYNVKHAAHETYRAMYLFQADREADTGLKCALGTRCRDCPILKAVEASLIEARANEKFPRQIEDEDIDAAKAWVCIGHALTSQTDPMDGAFFTTKEDREREPW